MRFSVYQINLSDKEYNNNEMRETYLDTIMNPKPEAINKARSFYSKVAEINAKDFEDVFEIGNIGPEENITRIKPMHSVSVGDVIVSEDGVCKFVAPFGFEQLTFNIGE